MFQFTRPRGARPRIVTRMTFSSASFNSRAREGRDSGLRLQRHCRCSFNSRAREGRDDIIVKPLVSIFVSIHAPARGATVEMFRKATVVQFQFTRPRGARPPMRGHRLFSPSFNSRAREGRDRWFSEDFQRRFVSIHAPARGATKYSSLFAVSVLFQFTRPRGARRIRQSRHCRYPFCFNSRAREGRDFVGAIEDEL